MTQDDLHTRSSFWPTRFFSTTPPQIHSIRWLLGRLQRGGGHWRYVRDMPTMCLPVWLADFP